MSYMPQQQILSSGVGVFNYSALSSVTFNNKLYVFYAGEGKDGVWYGVLDGHQWSGPFSCRSQGATYMGLADYTSPCAVVYLGKLFLFYNGSGSDGTYWTSSGDGATWSPVQSVSAAMGAPSETFAPYTSPAAAIYQKALYLVWNNSTGDGSLRYTLWNTNSTPTFKSPMTVPAAGLGIRRQTSASLAAFNGLLYLFFNGSGQDGTFFTTFDGTGWTAASQVSAGGDFLDYTSPAVFVSDDGRELTLIWNGIDNNGVFYTKTINGSTWLSQVSLANVIGGQGLLDYSSPCGVNYSGIPYIFWVGKEASVWCSQGLTLSAENGDLTLAMKALVAGNDFALITRDPQAVQYLQGKFPDPINPIPGPSSSLLEMPQGEKGEIIVPKAGENWAPVVGAFLRDQMKFIPMAVVFFMSLCAFALSLGYEVEVSIYPETKIVFRRPPQPKPW